MRRCFKLHRWFGAAFAQNALIVWLCLDSITRKVAITTSVFNVSDTGHSAMFQMRNRYQTLYHFQVLPIVILSPMFQMAYCHFLPESQAEQSDGCANVI
jgi:Mn2+/Fe2+ NRAMP family transporter